MWSPQENDRKDVNIPMVLGSRLEILIGILSLMVQHDDHGAGALRGTQAELKWAGCG